MANSENDVEHLEREVEQTRAHVSETLDALQTQVAGTVQEWRGRLSYEELSKDAKSYARNTATRMAHERPVLTGAIGLAVAYPFIKLATKIPLPFYLIGAGAYMMKPVHGGESHSYSDGRGVRFSGKYSGSSAASYGRPFPGTASGRGSYQPGYGERSVSSSTSTMTGAQGRQVGSSAGMSGSSSGMSARPYGGSGSNLDQNPGGMSATGGYSTGGAQYRRSGYGHSGGYRGGRAQGGFLGDLAQQARSMFSSFSGGGGSYRSGRHYQGGGSYQSGPAYQGGRSYQGGSNQGSSGLRSMADAASSALNSATGAVTHAAQSAAGAAASAAHGVADYASSAAGGISSAASRGTSYSRQVAPTNVWILGGLGLAIGAAAAAMLPQTRVENRWVGPTSDEVRRRARELANARVEEARHMLDRAYDVALEEAQNRGLTPDAARQSAEDFVSRIGEAAQRGAGIGNEGSSQGDSQRGAMSGQS